MNKRLNLLKENLKEHLRKRINFDVDDISFFSIPYSINIFGEGINGHVSKLINITIDKFCLMGFVESHSENIKIYDYNKNEIYEISPTKINKIKDEYSSILIVTYNSIRTKENVVGTFISCFHDDFYSTSLSSPAIKFALFVDAISKSNEINLDSQLFTSILKDTDNSLLNTKIDANELLSFKNNLFDNVNNKTEKLNWSNFNDTKVVQVSFEKKRLKKQNKTKLLSELKQSFDLLNVLMASARKKLITNFNPDEIKSFARRTSPEKQKFIEYIYNESSLIEKSISALKSKDMERFMNNINLSNSNVIQLELLDKKNQKFVSELRKINNIFAIKVSIMNNSVSMFIDANSEYLVMEEIKREVNKTFSEKKDDIKVYSSEIMDFYIYEIN